jgi:hypothetical protein
LGVLCFARLWGCSFGCCGAPAGTLLVYCSLLFTSFSIPGFHIVESLCSSSFLVFVWGV